MPGKSRSVLWSFNFAIAGVVYALRTQRNMRIHVAAAVLTLIGALCVLALGMAAAAWFPARRAASIEPMQALRSE